jgi:outer membrane protein assembly factor BamB
VPAWTGQLKELWRQPVGEGNSSPVVVGGRLYVHAKVKGKDSEEVIAFESDSGKEIWRKTYERAQMNFAYGNGPRATPSVVDGKVYTYGITGLLTCFDAAEGKILWQVDTWKDFAAPRLFFGAACSPLVDGGRVYVNVGAKGASVVAFGAAKGNVVWKSGDDPASYASPILTGTGAAQQLIVFTGKGIASLTPADGKLNWEFPLVDKLMESSTTPVRIGDRLLASSITYGSAALRLEEVDGKPGYAEAWKNAELTSYFATPVAVDPDHVYMVTGRLPLVGKPEASLHCVDMKTGKKLWTKPKVGEFHASLLRTGDNKLLLLEENGELVLVDPQTSGYKELARAKVCGHVWAHAAVADGKLFLRDDRDLICLQLPK